LRRNFTRSAMALTTSAPTRLEICEAQSPSRKPSRNFAVATPETEGKTMRRTPVLAPRSRSLVRFREGGRGLVGFVRIKLHYEAAVHSAPGERMDSEEPPNVRVACSGDIDEVVRLIHDAAAWMSAKG